MKLRDLRRLVDRIDHKHDDKEAMVAAAEGDYDLDPANPPVTTPDHVFLFIDPSKPVRK